MSPGSLDNLELGPPETASRLLVWTVGQQAVRCLEVTPQGLGPLQADVRTAGPGVRDICHPALHWH